METQTRINVIDEKLVLLQYAREKLFPVWNHADRALKTVEMEMQLLEAEKEKLRDSQLSFDLPF